MQRGSLPDRERLPPDCATAARWMLQGDALASAPSRLAPRVACAQGGEVSSPLETPPTIRDGVCMMCAHARRCDLQFSDKILILLVGAAGFEPAAPCSQKRGEPKEIKGFLTIPDAFTAGSINQLAAESEIAGSNEISRFSRAAPLQPNTLNLS